MRIALIGCAHGELEKIYDTVRLCDQKVVDEGQEKIGLVICCGDFQSIRHKHDLRSMAVPDKYKEMGTFRDYYDGTKTAPVLTLFIGGNHEASSYLAELPYGGWVAHNIYYMGLAGVVKFGGLRIAGISGIFKGHDYLKGHFEKPPFNNDTVRSVYHIRNLEIFRLKQLARNPPDVLLSHDWPSGIHNYGDTRGLLRRKKHFQDDIRNDRLGSRPTAEVLNVIKPRYAFAAHLHVKFSAVKEHEDGKVTKFLALDKCLPHRPFLQIVDISSDDGDEPKDLVFEHDPEWLAILKATDHLMSVKSASCYMPGPGSSDRYDFTPTQEELTEIRNLFDGNFSIEPFRKPDKASRRNAYSAHFCSKLGINDISCDIEFVEEEIPLVIPATPVKNDDEIEIDAGSSSDDDEEKDQEENPKNVPSPPVQEEKKSLSSVLPPPVQEEKKSLSSVIPPPVQEEKKRSGLNLPPPVHNEDEIAVDEKSSAPQQNEVEEKESEKVEENPPPKPAVKKLKRRNQNMYAENSEES